MTKTIVLGDEHDSHLRSVLGKVIRDMGAKKLDERWAVAGSQEVEITRLELRGKIIDLEAETYVGLSISGEEHDVDEIARRVAEMLKMYPTTADYLRSVAPGKGHR